MRPLLVPFVRFSSAGQADGDSERRQMSIDWEGTAKRHGCQLNHLIEAIRGVSAYSEDPFERAFELIRQGKIPAGSIFAGETLSRFWRQDPWTAMPKLCQLINLGMRLLTIHPEILYAPENQYALIMAVVEMQQAHGHSKDLQYKLTNAWQEKKAQARENNTPLTYSVPSWIEVVGREKIGHHTSGGEFRVIEERAQVIRQIFQWAIDGDGSYTIVKRLIETVPPWGKGQWSKPRVIQLLKSRTVLGEYAPMKRIGKKKKVEDGEPIPGFYPAIIDEATWHQAQAAMQARKRNKLGRSGKHGPSLFTGLLTDARTGSRMLITWQTRGPRGKRTRTHVLMPSTVDQGQRCTTFQYPAFERSLLAEIREISTDEVLKNSQPSQIARLRAELTLVASEIRELNSDPDFQSVKLWKAKARQLEDKQEKLKAEVDQEELKESNPLDAKWSDAKTLLDLAKDPQHRVKLRSLLQAIIDRVCVLIVPLEKLPSVRLALVQMYFVGSDYHRTFVIFFRGAGKDRPEICKPFSGLFGEGGCDLRDPAQAQRFAEQLNAVDPEEQYRKLLKGEGRDGEAAA